jgi:predicted ABC-class ATPase
MPDHEALQGLLRRIDGRSYPAFRDLRGRWRLGRITIEVDHVQGDPYAAPSRIRVEVATGIGPEITGDRTRRRAAEDWLLRRFGRDLRGVERGSGRSGEIRVLRPGPDISERSALRLRPDGLAEVRLTVGLPARGRRVLGREAWRLLSEDLPRAAQAIEGCEAEPDLAAHVATVDVQVALRAQLRARGLVAFIADGSVLPRASGVSQAPLVAAVPFTSPEGLRVSLDSPAGPVPGMGIPRGVTLITGGGFHGKSTLLHALQRGHLDHIPGDGRERVVSDPDTVKVRAEDGRRVAAVDVSAFLGTLPGGRSTRPFHTDDASGSTSQAAAVVESVQAGARVLLFDEDTSATNLMVRDARMAQLIPAEGEPITPLVGRVRQLRETLGVSCVLVVGGVGDYLGVSDTVVLMDHFHAREATARAHAIAGLPMQAPGPLLHPLPRSVSPDSLRPTGKGRVRARDERRVDHGQEEIDLRAVEQVLDGAHAASLGHALRLLSELLEGPTVSLGRALDALDAVLEDEGPDALTPHPVPGGALVRPRRHEVAAALNRLRTAVVEAEPG